MIKYSFARAVRTPRNFFAIARFAVVLGVVSLSSLPAQTREQQHPRGEVVPSSAIPPRAPASRSTDVFLSLAATVGQDIPAKRLVEYALRTTDPSGNGRYWAIVDFN